MNESRHKKLGSGYVPVGNLIDSLLARLGLAYNLGGWKAVVNWPEIAGPTIASHAKAVRYEDDTLWVSVPDASWRQELVMAQDEILEKIHALPGGRAVKKIHFIS